MHRPQWYVYILYSVSTGKLYTGITVDPERRLSEHNTDNIKGAKATRAGRPWRIVRIECVGPSRSQALKREAAIKKLDRKDKLILVGLSA